MTNREIPSTVAPLKEFDMGKDIMIIADGDNRHKSYIDLLTKKINELAEVVNAEIGKRKNLERRLETKLETAEQKAAKVIKA